MQKLLSETALKHTNVRLNPFKHRRSVYLFRPCSHAWPSKALFDSLIQPHVPLTLHAPLYLEHEREKVKVVRSNMLLQNHTAGAHGGESTSTLISGIMRVPPAVELENPDLLN